MKVSDEIRNWCEFEDGTECGGFVTKASFNKILALADRIDAEMVELPRDANDEPILPGDTVWGCISGTQMAVHELELTDRWAISTDTGFIPKASAVTHVRPDSFERIADELEAWCDGADVDGDACDVPRGIAVRIRKLADSFESIANDLEGLSVDSMISDINLVSSCALDLAKRIRRLAKKKENCIDE